jgi:Inorganic pyrophosphatase
MAVQLIAAVFQQLDIDIIDARCTKGESWHRNDRLIAVAAHAQNVQSLEDLRPHLIDEIKEFFIVYNRLRGRKFKPLALTAQRNRES